MQVLSAILTEMRLGYFEDVFQAHLLKWTANQKISMEAKEEMFITWYAFTILFVNIKAI